MTFNIQTSFIALTLAGALVACSSGGDDGARSAQAPLTFAEFEARAYHDPSGGYVINGDEYAPDEHTLREFYQRYLGSEGDSRARLVAESIGDVARTSDPLVVSVANGTDQDWSELERVSLSYCVSKASFDASGAGRYNAAVAAMNTAAAAWEQVTKVRYTHVVAQDSACTNGNAIVAFNVVAVSGAPYTARAFFPDYARANRQINIDGSAFSLSGAVTLAGVLRHELGHTLGFRHEHTRPDSGSCFEDNDWRALTAYDAASVMHYPQCNGTNTGDLLITARDREGARRLYYQTGVYFADVTGDGPSDALVLTSNSVVNRRSSGSAFNANETWSSVAYFGELGSYFADVTGDGRADAIVVNAGGVTVRRSTGSAFSANETWASSAFFGAKGNFFADVTGDGRADAIVIGDGGITVRRSNGSTFGASEVWSSVAYFGNVGTYFADVTGDGRADAIVINSTGTTVRRSNGSSFGANENWTTNGFFGQRDNFFADVTGDGRADSIVVNDAGVTIRRSNGSSFNANENWTTSAFFGTRGTFFADVTGDGRADAIAVNDGGVTVRPSNGTTFGANQAWTVGAYFGVE